MGGNVSTCFGDVRRQQFLQTLPLHLKCGLPVRRQQVHKAVEQREWLLKRKLDEAEALWLKVCGILQDEFARHRVLNACEIACQHAAGKGLCKLETEHLRCKRTQVCQFAFERGKGAARRRKEKRREVGTVGKAESSNFSLKCRRERLHPPHPLMLERMMFGLDQDVQAQ